MAEHNHEEETNLSPQEKLYRDLMRQGHDFEKIDLFLSAKNVYKKALKVKPGDKTAQEKIYMCDETIGHDRIKVLITVPIVAAAIFALFYFLGFPD